MSAIIGAQVYGLKQEFEQDLEGTLEQIADMGFGRFEALAIPLAEQYKDRIVDLHCRDFYPAAFSGRYTRTEMQAELFAPVGLGSIPVRGIMKAARSFPHFSGDYVVEQEKSAHSMLADLELSCRNLRKWLEEDS